MITASINVGPLLAKLQRLGITPKKPLQAMVREQTRLFVSSTGTTKGMIQEQPPASKGVKGSAAKAQGENKVRSDIRKVDGTEGTTDDKLPHPHIRRAWWKAVKAGNTKEAERLTKHLGVMVQIPIGPFDAGALHRRRRSNQTGNVRGTHPELIVSNPKLLEAYIKMRQKRVGTLASGFNLAAQDLKANGVPAWIKRHGSNFGNITIQDGPNSFYITLADRVPFGKADTIRRMGYVLKYRNAAMARAMPAIIRHAIKTAGFSP
jgi:hypothetical protein